MNKRCPKEQELSAYMDQALSHHGMARVRRHVENCAVCRDKVAALQQADEMIRLLPEFSPSAGFDTTFWSKVAWVDADRRKTFWPFSWMERFLLGWRPVLAAGLTAGVVAGFFLCIRPDPRPSFEEVFISDNLELFSEFELIEHLDLFENWKAIQSLEGQG